MKVSFAKILPGTVLALINFFSCSKLILGRKSNSAFLHVPTVSRRDRGRGFRKDTGPPVSSFLPLLSSPDDGVQSLLDEAIRLRKRAAEIRDQATVDERALVEERAKGAAPSRRRFHEFLGQLKQDRKAAGDGSALGRSFVDIFRLRYTGDDGMLRLTEEFLRDAFSRLADLEFESLQSARQVDDDRDESENIRASTRYGDAKNYALLRSDIIRAVDICDSKASAVADVETNGGSAPPADDPPSGLGMLFKKFVQKRNPSALEGPSGAQTSNRNSTVVLSSSSSDLAKALLRHETELRRDIEVRTAQAADFAIVAHRRDGVPIPDWVKARETAKVFAAGSRALQNNGAAGTDDVRDELRQKLAIQGDGDLNVALSGVPGGNRTELAVLLSLPSWVPGNMVGAVAKNGKT